MDKKRFISATYIGLIASIGMFLSTLDSGIINIAIPTLIKEFNTSVNHIIWVVTLYTLVLCATILFFGRLADRFGRLKIYKLGLLVFAVSSLLCGLANSSLILIIFRGLQGLGAAMMQATAAAIITTRVDQQDRAKTLGLLGMLLGLGPLMGPVLGGFILSTIGWRWIFWLNIPICLVGLYGCRKIDSSEPQHKQPQKEFSVTPEGCKFLQQFDIDVNALIKSKRRFARRCLNWTERQYHSAGSLGSALLEYFFNQRLVIRSKQKPRVLICMIHRHGN